MILRVRTPSGMKRVNLENGALWRDLTAKVQELCGVDPMAQIFQLGPRMLDAVPGNSLAQLGLKHGDMLHLVSAPPPAASSSKPATKPPPQLTKDCRHGPRGRCLHCSGVQPGAKPEEYECKHGPNETCFNCSEHVADTKAAPADWLCNHSDSTFCNKCLPSMSEEDKLAGKTSLSCSCRPEKGERCTRCSQDHAKMKVDKIPFGRMVAERRAICKFKHNKDVLCGFCAPPKMPSYTGKKNCNSGHRPWPQGVCLKCAPENAVMLEQPYRHCDVVQLNAALTQAFYAGWVRGGKNKQRAAVLLGQYIDEPESSKLKGAIRAVVHAMYEPPQEALTAGVRFLRDPKEKTVYQIAERCGLVPVGWIITSAPRSGRKFKKKYGGDILMSGPEVRQAARFQGSHTQPSGHSRFVTVIVEHGDQVEPKAYQMSDQCVALEAANCFTDHEDPNFMCQRAPKRGEIVPTVVYKNTPLAVGKGFLPDDFLVKVIISTGAGQGKGLFKHSNFPSGGGDMDLRSQLAEFSREEYATRLSDFNLLLYLSTVIGLPLTLEICDAIRERRSLTADAASALDMALMQKNLL